MLIASSKLEVRGLIEEWLKSIIEYDCIVPCVIVHPLWKYKLMPPTSLDTLGIDIFDNRTIINLFLRKRLKNRIRIWSVMMKGCQ